MAAARRVLPDAEEEVGAAGDRPAPPPRKKLVRRRARDWSQQLRLATQSAFVLLNIAIGMQFFAFVRHFETSGAGSSPPRPAGVEGWLPIAGMMNLKYFLSTGEVPAIHPAAMFLFVVFVGSAFLFRKAFCSWLCPVGTLSEALWKLGRRFLKTNWALPRWFDIPLRGLKYLLFGFFLWAVGGLSAAGIAAFMGSPYGLVADVKMLHFFRYLSTTAAVTLVVLAILSVFYQNFWCRYLCPYGALMGLASTVSPAAIRRDPDRCIDCAKCARACPSLLAVDKLVTIRSAECTGCFECVAVCPAEGALDLAVSRKRTLPAWAVAAGLAVLFLGIVGFAKWAGHWDGQVPDAAYRELLPELERLQHP